jgi:hypothetical protein
VDGRPRRGAAETGSRKPRRETGPKHLFGLLTSLSFPGGKDVGGPIAPSEWDRLAELQRALGALDCGGDVSGVTPEAGRGVRLRLARIAVESLIRADADQRSRQRRQEFERALAGFAERAARRAQAAPAPLALPSPAVPTVATPGAGPVLPKPPSSGRAAAGRRTPARRRFRPPPAPPPEFWSPRPVLAFRMWDVRGRLQGAFQAWDRPVRVARCVSGRTERDDGEVPHTDGRCGQPPCGIYGFKEPGQLLASFGLPEGSRRRVYGLVALSGKVVEHERGYRGQRARVVAAAVVGRGRLVRVEGIERMFSLFLAPDEAVAGLIATDARVVEEIGDPLETAEALIAYLSLARDFYEVTSP